MSVLVRLKEGALGLQAGADAAVTGPEAKFLFEQGKCSIVGGDAADLEAAGLALCEEGVPPPIPVGAPEGMAASVIPGPKEG